MIYELYSKKEYKDKVKEISELQLSDKRKIGRKIVETAINYLYNLIPVIYNKKRHYIKII